MSERASEPMSTVPSPARSAGALIGGPNPVRAGTDGELRVHR